MFRKEKVPGFILPGLYAGEGTRTPTVSHQNLNLARLPIPPHPRNSSHNIQFNFTKVNLSKYFPMYYNEFVIMNIL